MPSKVSSTGLKTIRGSMEINIGNIVTEELVFSYESPDRTRGWKIEGAYIWIENPITSVAGSGNALLLANLATDSYIKNVSDILDASDNRSLAWHSKQYHYQNGTFDFIYPNATDTSMSAFLIDLERIVTNELYITAGFLPSVSPSSIKQTISYMIVLREVSLTPSQSLLQQLKGIGQNIDN